MKTILLPLIAGIAMSACATMSDVIKEKQNGTAQLYPVTKEQAWKAAISVFRWEGGDSIEEHKDENYMLTSSGAGLVSMGTLMGAWIEPKNGTHTKVTVVTKRRIATNIATTLTEATFHQRFQQAIEILAAGKPLPPDAPAIPARK